MDKLVFALYKHLLSPGLICLLHIFKNLAPVKLRESIADRDSEFTQFNSLLEVSELRRLKPIWLHAASGEIEYARPLIRELKKKYPHTPLLVTYSSPSAKKILATLSEVDVWTSIPWETEKSVQHFIQKWNPRIVLFARTDVWPVLAETCAKNGIPSLLFAATFATNSSRLRGLSLRLNRFALNCLDKILCVDEEDKKSLEKAQVQTPLLVTGDTRFDQVFHRLSNPKPLKSFLMPSPEDFVFICGSTWPEDESVIFEALPTLIKNGVRVILAPHEAQKAHLHAMETNLRQKNLDCTRYSSATSWNQEILIIDQVGILAELYTWADIAFVGGSFKKQVHSVMEALAAGLPILVGPHHQNNREALKFKKQHYSAGLVVHEVQTSQDIETLVLRCLRQLPHMPVIKEEIRSQTAKMQQASALTLEEVENLSLLDVQADANLI